MYSNNKDPELFFLFLIKTLRPIFSLIEFSRVCKFISLEGLRECFLILKILTKFSWFLSIYAVCQSLGIDIAKLDTKGLSPVVLTYGNSNFAGGMLSVLFGYHFTYFMQTRKKSFSPVTKKKTPVKKRPTKK